MQSSRSHLARLMRGAQSQKQLSAIQQLIKGSSYSWTSNYFVAVLPQVLPPHHQFGGLPYQACLGQRFKHLSRYSHPCEVKVPANCAVSKYTSISKALRRRRLSALTSLRPLAGTGERPLNLKALGRSAGRSSAAFAASKFFWRGRQQQSHVPPAHRYKRWRVANSRSGSVCSSMHGCGYSLNIYDHRCVLFHFPFQPPATSTRQMQNQVPPKKNTCLTGIMTWVGLCMPKLKKDVISWCNNGNNTSAKWPRMRVKKASGQHNPNSNDLKRATRATFKQRISFWNRSCWSQKTDTSCITLWCITLWHHPIM